MLQLDLFRPDDRLNESPRIDGKVPTRGQMTAAPGPRSVSTGAPATELSAIRAGPVLGCSRDAVVRLVRNGFLTGGCRIIGKREHWHVTLTDWLTPLRQRMVLHQASDPPLENVAEFRRFDECRVLSGCQNLPVSDHWIASLFALPDRYEGHDFPQEIRAVLTAPDDEVARVSRALQLMEDDGRLYADRIAIPEGDLRAAIIAALGHDMPSLEFTWVQRGGPAGAAIGDAAVARLLSIPAGIRRQIAIAHVASAVANGEMSQDNVTALSHARAYEILLDVDPDDPDAIEERWTAFLQGRIMPTLGRSARIRTFHDELACERTLVAMAAEPVSLALKEWIARHVPLIPDGEVFWDLVRDTVSCAVTVGDRRRKGRSDKIADAYDGHAAEAEAALAEIRGMSAGIQKGHRAACGSAAWEFSFPAPMRDAAGRETGGTMLVDMVSMRAGDLLDALVVEALARGDELTPRSFLRSHAAGGRRFDPAVSDRRVAVYVGVEAVEYAGGGGGGVDAEAAEPGFIADLRAGVTLPPGMLDDATIEARRARLCARNLPIPTLRPRNLFTGDAFDRNLMVWALRSGLIVVPDLQILQGRSIGNLFYRMSVANAGRAGAALQIVDDPSGFGEVPDGAGGRLPAYNAVPKFGNGMAVLHPLDTGTLAAFKRHIALTLEIEGTADRPPAERKRLPPVEPSPSHPACCGVARYGFQAGGRALTVGNLNYCLSHTFGRLMLTHDPRHGGANRRRRDGASGRDVADDLLQKSEAVARKYSRPTAAERSAGGGRAIRLSDAMAKLGVGADVGARSMR